MPQLLTQGDGLQLGSFKKLNSVFCLHGECSQSSNRFSPSASSILELVLASPLWPFLPFGKMTLSWLCGI